MYFARTLSGLLLAILSVGVAFAQIDAPPVQTELAYASRAVFRGVERAGDSLQASVELNGERFHGGLRTVQPLGGDSPSEATLTAGYRWVASDQVTLEASVAHTWYDGVPGDGVKRSLEGGIAATFAPMEGFTPTVRYFHDFRFLADTIELALGRSVALTKLGAFLELNLIGGWTNGRDWKPDRSGPRTRDSYGYWGGEVSLPYRIGAHATVVAGAHYAGTSGRSAIDGPFGRSRQPGAWVSFGVNLDF
jgi:hypothetical protein